jgi:hypothetical protein
MPEKVGWWAVFSVVGVGAFGMCIYGFFFLHGLIVNDKAYASSALSAAVESRTHQMDRMADLFEMYRAANDKDHRQLMIGQSAIAAKLGVTLDTR